MSAPIDIDGKSFELIPFFLYVWDSQLLTKYHYGVTANEAASSNFAQYQPKDSFTPHLGFWFMANDLKPWTIGTSYSVAFLPDSIKNSPIVEKKSIGSFVFFLQVILFDLEKGDLFTLRNQSLSVYYQKSSCYSST